MCTSTTTTALYHYPRHCRLWRSDHKKSYYNHDKKSCQGDRACFSGLSRNKGIFDPHSLSVGSESCNGAEACYGINEVTIGKKSCNHDNACSCLERNTTIGDKQCNGTCCCDNNCVPNCISELLGDEVSCCLMRCCKWQFAETYHSFNIESAIIDVPFFCHL